MFRVFLYNLRIAFADMLRKPFRTFLVLQGMIWGAAAAIMPPAIIDGSRRAMVERASQVGTDRVVLTADTMDEAGAMTADDVAYLQETFGASLNAIAPFRVERAVFRCGDRLESGWVIGTTEGEIRARALTLQSGRFFTEDGAETVLEPGVSKSLGGTVSTLPAGPVEVFLVPPEAKTGFIDPPHVLNPEDEVVAGLLERIQSGQAQPALPPLTPVGMFSTRIMERKDVNDFGIKRNHFLSGVADSLMSNMGVIVQIEPWRESGYSIHVPLRMLAREDGRIDMIVLRAKPETVVDLIKDLQKGLSERSRTPLIRWNLLAPVFLKGGVDRYTRLRYATFLLCLVMGGIVISNVMLFYVLENYRDIAIRRVEGATKWDIAFQYLAYSTFLSLTGGILGLPIGMFVAQVRIWIAPQAALSLTFPWGSATLVVACTAAAGMLAGVLPAYRAASLDPVKALRHE
jgi:ABC-type lipoprotein release transport system permease subunit